MDVFTTEFNNQYYVCGSNYHTVLHKYMQTNVTIKERDLDWGGGTVAKVPAM